MALCNGMRSCYGPQSVSQSTKCVDFRGLPTPLNEWPLTALRVALVHVRKSRMSEMCLSEKQLACCVGTSFSMYWIPDRLSREPGSFGLLEGRGAGASLDEIHSSRPGFGRLRPKPAAEITDRVSCHCPNLKPSKSTRQQRVH